MIQDPVLRIPKCDNSITGWATGPSRIRARRAAVPATCIFCSINVFWWRAGIAGEGHVGENLFAYSPDDKTWHGMFADNQGHTHIFVNGKVSAGAAEFDG